ncbi:MAG: choice-of-anchor E domain-containing protein, partial [Methanothrix sp.]|nr:choice-of-anchor E domain-containing protein [Methanothrix sp.]
MVIVILSVPSFAAVKTVSYSSTIPSQLTDWSLNHNLPLFDPALGKLLRVDFYATVNGTFDGKAENTGPSIVLQSYLQSVLGMDVQLLDGSSLIFSKTLRYPTSGFVVVSPYDGITDYAGVDSFSGGAAGYGSSSVTYTNQADLAYYIASYSGETADFLSTVDATSAAKGSGNFQSIFNTWAGSYAKITYYYDSSHCLSGYKLNGCTNTGLSSWTINVSNTTKSWSITTNASGFWEKCGLDDGGYTICETPQSGWVQTLPVSGCYSKTIAGANLTKINFTNVKPLCISGYKYNACNGAPLEGWEIKVFNATTNALKGTATTNALGFWQVCGLVPGNYWANETVQDGWVTTIANQSVTLLCANQESVNFYNTPKLCISGYKYNACNGQPLYGWQINVYNASTGAFMGSDTTDERGAW